MKNCLVTNEQYQYLKERYNSYDVDKQADRRIRKLIKAIAGVDGFVPVWSCSGHTYEESKQHDLDSHADPVEDDTGHVIFAVSEAGLDSLKDLVAFHQDTPGDFHEWSVVIPFLSLRRLWWAFDDYDGTTTYPVVELGFNGSADADNHEAQSKYFQSVIRHLTQKR